MSSPGRADILPKSRRAREIKAITGQNGCWKVVMCFYKKSAPTYATVTVQKLLTTTKQKEDVWIE